MAPDTLRLTRGSTHAPLDTVLAVRNYKTLGRFFAEPAQIELALGVILAAGADGATLDDIVAASAGARGAITRFDAERIAMWLLKYGFAARV